MKKFQRFEINKSTRLINKAICLPSGYNIDEKKNSKNYWGFEKSLNEKAFLSVLELKHLKY